MTRPKPVIAYGTRGNLGGADSGIRRVANTFGKELHLTSSVKAAERLAVESDAERLVSHLFTVDPRVRRFAPQPFTVDLIDRRVLRTADEVCEARHRHRKRSGWRFYTPDYGLDHATMPRAVVEVKLEGFEGSSDYEGALCQARSVLDAAGYSFTRLVVPANAKHPLRVNLQLLKMAAHRSDLLPDDERLSRISTICDGEPVALGELCATLEMLPGVVPVLLLHGLVKGDVARQRICGAMRLEAAHGDLSHLHLLEELAK